MIIDKNREKQRRLEEIDDFNANFTEDLVQKWNNNNQKDFNEKLQSMMQVQDFKQSAAQYYKNGEKVAFPKNLKEMQKIDEIKADKVMSKINSQDIQKEKLVDKKSKDMTVDAQKSNFATLLAKQAIIFKKGRGTRNSVQSFTSDQAGQPRIPYYASVKIPDVMNEVDLNAIRL